MLDLIEELHKNETIYTILETNNSFLYGEYKVSERIVGSMKNQYAKLVLVNAPKKARYFRKLIEFKGFRIEFNYTPKTYKVYDNFGEMVKDFYRDLIKNPDDNQKLIKKLKNNYPSYCK